MCDFDHGTNRHAAVFLLNHFAAVDQYLGAMLPVFRTGAQGKFGDRCDGGQRFAAKAEATHFVEVGSFTDLAGRVAL